MTQRSPEVLPGVSPEQDCAAPSDIVTPLDPAPLADAVWQPPRGKFLRGLERLALAVERPINRLVGNPAYNPLYHTDTIAVFLWLIVGATGIYLSLFVQFGFDGIYHAISKMESQLVAHVIRAIHRYASDAAIIFSVLHGARLFFMGRFRGPRWLAWVTGVVMVGLLVLDGITGYWLVWDQRAQLIITSFTNWLGRLFGTSANFVADIQMAWMNDTSWIWIGLLLLAHILLFVIVAVGYWLHVKRLSRPKFLPAQPWLIGLTVVVIVISAAAPLGMLPPANFEQLPGAVPLDPLYLFFVPLEVNGTANGLWLVALLAIAAVAVFPWLPLRRKPVPPVTIDKDRCTGCTKCALDCPYQAISMVPRTDGKIHKFVARENLELCAACGVCVGSCDVQAISIGPLSRSALWTIVDRRIAAARERVPAGRVTIAFTCERHADQGARPYLNPIGSAAPTEALEVITLPCVASAPPDLVSHALDLGASEARVIGCPPGDCARREGNVWTEGRLTRTRMPRLRRNYASAPIGLYWLPPDEFSRGLHAPLTASRLAAPFSWRNLIPALVLVAILYVAVTALNWLPYTPYTDGQAGVQIVLPSLARLFDARADERGIDRAQTTAPVRLVLKADEQVLFEQTYSLADLQSDQAGALYEDIRLAPGDYRVQFQFESQAALARPVRVYDRAVKLDAGQVLMLDLAAGAARHDRHRP